MAPGRHATCPCGWHWSKNKDVSGYTCEGGHHSINEDGNTPGEAAWVKQRAADKNKLDGEDSRRRDVEKGKRKLREEQARKDKDIADAAEKKKVKERVRQFMPAKQPPPDQLRETEAARARRKSREKEINELREARLKVNITIAEPPHEVKQEAQSTPRRTESSRKTKKTSDLKSTPRQLEPDRRRQETEDIEVKPNEDKEQRRPQEYIDSESAAERSEAWARISAIHAAASCTPAAEAQILKRPGALPAPNMTGVTRPARTTRQPLAIPAPAPSPVNEPLPWARAPVETSRQKREHDLVPVGGRRPKRENEKMPWE